MSLKRTFRAARASCSASLDRCASFLFRPFITSAPEQTGTPRRILIVRLDRIGDVVLSTPALRAVRQTFPAAVIDLLVVRYTEDLVCRNPDLSRVMVYGRDRLDKNYDLAIALHPGLRQNFLCFSSGAARRIGYAGAGGFLLTHPVPDDRQERVRHEVVSALELVRVAGCSTDDTRLRVSVTQEGESFSESFFTGHPYAGKLVCIHPGSRQGYIRWEAEKFAALSDMIMETGNTVLLTGTAAEERLVECVRAGMKKRPLLAVGLRLTHLVSLLRRCSLFVGNSTGPMHIACALDVPVIAIFGNVHPLDSYQEWGPWGTGHRIISRNMACRPCHPGDCTRFDCLRSITVGEVSAPALEVLSR